MRAKKASRIARAALLIAVGTVGVAKADLVASWNFDGTANDQSSNNNNGMLLNGVTFSNDVPSMFAGGQSLLFGGGGQHVLVPDSNSLDISSAMTISGWVKPIGNVAWDAVIAKNPSDGSVPNQAGNYELRIENGSRRLTFLHQRGGPADTVAYSSSGFILSDLWQHFAVTAQSGGQVRFYINGEPSGAANVNGTFGVTNSSPVYIGSRADLFTTMDGLIDELKVYNEVLSPQQIGALAGGIPEKHPGISPVFARASSFFTGDNRVPANAVSGSGLVGKVHANVAPAATMWLSNAGDVAPTFEIDLGGVYKVDDVRVWNYNEQANATCCLGRGVKTADVFVAGADGVYGSTPVVTNASFSIAPGTNTDFSQVLGLSGIDARYIRLNVTSNHGDAQFTGLSEMRVSGNPVVGQAPLPVKVSNVSSNLVGFNRGADFAVNGAGKLFGDAHSTAPDGGMWLNQGTFSTGAPDTDPSITFDLGSVVPLDRMKVWNYNEIFAAAPDRTNELLGRGIQLANIEVAGEDGVFTTFIEGQEFERAPGLTTLDFGQVVDFGGAPVRFVRLDILSNYNGKDFTDPLDDDGLQNFAGLSEVQFFAVVPEPSAVAVILVGAAMAGARRRRI